MAYPMVEKEKCEWCGKMVDINELETGVYNYGEITTCMECTCGPDEMSGKIGEYLEKKYIEQMKLVSIE